MSKESTLPRMSAQTEFGELESRDNLLHVKVVKPGKYITFEGPDALPKTVRDARPTEI